MPLRSGRTGAQRVDLLLLLEEQEENSLEATLAVARLLCCDVRPGRAGLSWFSLASKLSSSALYALTEEWRAELGHRLEQQLPSAVPSLKSCLRAAMIALQGKMWSGQLREVVLVLTSSPERIDDDCLGPLYALAHSRNVRRAGLCARVAKHLSHPLPPSPQPRRSESASLRLRPSGSRPCSSPRTAASPPSPSPSSASQLAAPARTTASAPSPATPAACSPPPRAPWAPSSRQHPPPRSLPLRSPQPQRRRPAQMRRRTSVMGPSAPRG